jgi:hypothetical protein
MQKDSRGLGLHWLYPGVVYSTDFSVKTKGLFTSFLLGFMFLYAIYGNLLLNANSVYFGASGDGFKSYYSGAYQGLHDSSYWRMSGMNFPYGEQSFFTDNQPLLTAAIKFFSNNFVDITPYTIGIVNSLMLMSILLCCITMFLIFNRLRLPWFYAALVSVGITFLAPQLQRMGGHYSLSYSFAIPLFTLLLMRFDEKADWPRSFALMTLVLIMAFSHLYYWGFFALIALVYYAYRFWKEKTKQNFINTATHFSVQIIIPYAVIALIIFFTGEVSDRTTSPWGFLHYRSAWEGVFLPINRASGNWISENITAIRPVEWEGQAFIGHFASVSFIILLFVFLFRFIKKKAKFSVTGNEVTDVVFVASLLALLYSFGIPFIFNLEFLLEYLGPLKQMRGIARFSWIFFFMSNIAVFYLLYRLLEKKNIFLRSSLLILPLALLFYDGYYGIRAHDYYMNNRIAELEKKSVEYEAVLKKIKEENYTAILPLPFFAVGSENVWVITDGELEKQTLILSLRTGIPTFASMLARTSLSQTFNRLQLIQEPYRPLEMLNTHEIKGKILILAKEDILKTTDKEIVELASKVADYQGLSFFEVNFDLLANRYKSTYRKAEQEMQSLNLFATEGFLSSSEQKDFLFYGTFKPGAEFTESNRGLLKEPKRLIEEPVPAVKPGEDYVVSFHFNGYRKDLYCRTIIEVAFVDTINNISQGIYNSVGNCLAAQDGETALIEWQFEMPEICHKVQVTIWNTDAAKEKEYYYDNILLKPASTQLFKEGKDFIFKNNRFYLKSYTK